MLQLAEERPLSGSQLLGIIASREQVPIGVHRHNN
jgi:hypothetical protein